MNILILQQAAQQLGVKEIAGDEDNKTIVGYSHDIGLSWINDDETPWCAIFVCWVLWKCGLSHPASAAARSFESYGIEILLSEAEPGDIIVFWRGSKTGTQGHVGFFLGCSLSGHHVFILGGNQGNMVGAAKYPVSQILSVRRAIAPNEDVNLEIPEAPLKSGDSGERVRQLQSILLYLGLYTKKIDGSWGEGTTSAVIAFQGKYNLPKSGAYGADMQQQLFTLLNQ